jgi:GT2 family glycosyltransferase
MDQDIKYWKQGEHLQNFGDFLSQYFLQHLFYAQPTRGQVLHVIGSCIDDMFVPSDTAEPRIFWGCGLRTPDGLSEDRFALAEILAVRGPLTRSALRLGETVPIGDPGLLLPALHKAARLNPPTGRALLVPHFHEKRSDLELQALTGCDEVLRPNIQNDLGAIDDFIERLVAADFVLTGSLHAAITAAAYGSRFGFWDSGDIDLPFKWEDFAASINIPCAFHVTRGAAEAHYDAELAPRLQLPVLWPLLVAAPLPVRPDAFASIVELDMRRHGTACFDLKVSSRAANRLQARLQQVAAEAETANSLRQDLIQRQEAAEQAEQAMRERIAAMFAVEAELQAEIASRTKAEAELQQQLDAAQEICAAVQLQAAEAERRNAALQMAADEAAQREEELRQVKAREAARLRRLGEPPEPTGAALQAELAFLRGREAWLAAEEARLHEAIQQRNHALAATERALLAEQQLVRSMAASVSWHLTAPLRLVGRPLRRLRGLSLRAWRLLRMIITLQLGRKLQERRSLQAHIQDLEASPLFDSAFYQREHPGVAATRAAAAQHYVLVGAAAGFAPNPMFDGAWYDATYRPEGAGGSTALWHYIKHGAASGHDPHPVFDTAWYVAENPQAGGPGGALAHYLAEGAAAGLAPNRFFDVQGYLYEYGEARESGLDPVQHYLRLGAAKGFDPHAFFDTDWYIATHKSAAASGMNPLAYHLRHGAAAGYDTWPWQNRLASFTIDAPLELPSWDAPEVSIVIPAYGHYFDTLRCLNSIAANSGRRVSFETIVIDDKPAQPIAPLLAGINGLRVECNAENLGFLHSCNRADGLVSGWHIIFLNNDTIVCRDWLEPLVEIARTDPRTGMIGCKLLNMDGTVQEAGGIIYDDGWGYPFGQGDISTKPEYNYVRHVDVVTGAAFLIRRDLFRALSGFDVRYAPAFYEEFDLALQVRQAGYEVVYQPRSEVIHLGSSSYGPETRDRQSLRNHAQFCLKWENVLDRQPKREAYLFEARQRPGHIGTILMIDDKLPEYDRHAGALTVFQYILLLRQLGFRLVFAPADGLAREPYGTRLQDLGVEVLYGPAQPESWLRENGARLLAVWIARPDVTAPRLDMLRRYTEALILYYPHDLHYLREMRRYELTGDLGALAESHRVKRLEKRIFETVDCVMTPSAEEAPVISRLVPGTKTRVIPPYLYPAGSATSRDAAHFSGCDTILFVGGFNHPPNVDAVLWLVRDIMPIVWQTRLAAHVLIVGSDPTAEIAALASDKVEVTGHVAELDPYFARALRWRPCATAPASRARW